MVRVLKLAAAIGLFALCGALFYRFFLPSLSGGGEMRAPAANPPPTIPIPGVPPELVEELTGAGDLVAARRLRYALEQYRGTREYPAIRRVFERRGADAANNLRREVENLLPHRYRSAAELAASYRRHWYGATAESDIAAILDELRAAQELLVEGYQADAETLLESEQYEAAREAIRTNWELEQEYRDRLDRFAENLEKRIHLSKRAASPGGAPRPDRPRPVIPVASGEPGPPPPLPGYAHPDVRRLDDARVLLRKCRDLYLARRYEPAQHAVKELLGSYGDLDYVDRYRDSLQALDTLCRHALGGIKALFHAHKVSVRGSRVTLTYLFRDKEEFLDWEEIKTLPHKDSGNFEPGRNAARGHGVMAYVHRAFFKNDVSIRCTSTPMAPKTHGLAFCQQGLETRQIMLLATNHWFVEGENYVKERPGHSLVMIGKGTNADVPVDSPEIGFIFRVTRDQPGVKSGDSLDLTFEIRKDTMKAEVEANGRRSTLRGRAVGDDGRGISRVRPALFVVQASVRFERVVIDGVLWPAFEKFHLRDLMEQVDDLPAEDSTSPRRTAGD